MSGRISRFESIESPHKGDTKMEIFTVWTFIAAVIVVGIGTGIWLQAKLEASGQDVKLGSAISEGKYVHV
jgi:hypothetical protein